MGCWNETCALTDLPIMYNERVIMIEGSYKLDFNIFFDTVDKICRGTYNDYGFVNEINLSYDQFNTIFIKEKAWNIAVEYVKSMPDIYTSDLLPIHNVIDLSLKMNKKMPIIYSKQLLEELRHVAAFADCIRKSLVPRAKNQGLYLGAYEKLYEIQKVLFKELEDSLI